MDNEQLEPVERQAELSQVQNDFCDSDALYRAFCGGVGSGKTWVGAFDLFVRALSHGGTYMAASPTSIMMSDTTFPAFREIAQSFGEWDERNVTLRPYPNVRLSNGAVIRFRTADDPEKMRGPNLTGIWLDEASLMHEDAYKIAIARLRQGGQLGWLSATFTPKGPQHWTHEIFATGNPDTAIFRATTGDNPFLHADFEAKLTAQYGDTNFARQEIGGEFVQLEGAEFPGEWFNFPEFWFDAWPDDLILKVIALDPSKGTDGNGTDYQAHVLLGVRIESGRYVIYCDADLDRLGVVPMCARTVELYKLFSAGRTVDSVVCEENGTMGLLAPALDAAAVNGSCLLPYLLRTNTDKKEFRIRQQVAPLLSRRQIRIRRTRGGRMLAGQLQAFPHDEHDDGPDALATGLKRVAELLGGAA